jgi:hypothetical protein
MKRNLPILLGLALGLAALTGCVQAPSPAPCPAFTAPPPAAPPPAAMVIPPTPVWTPPRRHVAVVAHPVHHVVVHHYVTHKYVARAAYRVLSPSCGSVAHPCDVDHRVVPVQ